LWLWLKTDDSEERIASIISVKRIGELGTTLIVTINRTTLVLQLLVNANVVLSSRILVTLMMEGKRSFETPVLTRATRLNIPEDGILYSHRRVNLKSYIALTGWVQSRRRNVFPVRYELGFISQKTAFFIVTAMKNSNLI
jgi:hypothetical protein